LPRAEDSECSARRLGGERADLDGSRKRSDPHAGSAVAGVRQLNLLHEGLSLSAEAGDQASITYCLKQLARVAVSQNLPTRAVRIAVRQAGAVRRRADAWIRSE